MSRTQIVIGVAVLLFGVVAFFIVDVVGITPTKTTTTVVVAKQFIAAQTTGVLLFVGETLQTVTTPVPASYRISYRIAGKDFSTEVEKSLFVALRAGDKIEVDYAHGRLTGDCRPVRVRGHTP